MQAALERRAIAQWVIKLPGKVTSKQKTELLEKAKVFATLLGAKPAMNEDLAVGGLVWPATERHTKLRAEFLALVKKMQAGPVVAKIPVASPKGKKKGSKDKKNSEEKIVVVPAAAPFKPALSPRPVAADYKEMPMTEEHEGDINPGETFDLPAKVLKDMKSYMKTKKAATLVTIAEDLFAAIYEEREAQDVDVARTLDVSALSNDPDPETDQAEVISKFPPDKLRHLVDAVNHEVRVFNRFEASFDRIRERARAEAANSKKGRAALHYLLEQETKLKELEAKGAADSKIKTVKKAIKQAILNRDEIFLAVEEEMIKHATRDNENAMAKRLNEALLGRGEFERVKMAERIGTALEQAKLTDDDFLNAYIAQLRRKFPERTSIELRAMKPAELKAMEEQESVRATLLLNLAKTRKDLGSKERAHLADQYIQTRRALRNAVEGSPEEEKLGAQLDAFEGQFNNKKKKAAPVGEEEEDDDDEEEEDEDFKPDESDDEEEEEDEEEDDAATAAGAAHQKPRRPQPRIRAPKTHSGAGSFSSALDRQSQPLDDLPPMFRASLPRLAPRPRPVGTLEQFRQGGQYRRGAPMAAMAAVARGLPPPMMMQHPLAPVGWAPRFHQGAALAAPRRARIARAPRVGGGCGCDPMSAPPKDDDL